MNKGKSKFSIDTLTSDQVNSNTWKVHLLWEDLANVLGYGLETTEPDKTVVAYLSYDRVEVGYPEIDMPLEPGALVEIIEHLLHLHYRPQTVGGVVVMSHNAKIVHTRGPGRVN